MATIMRRRIIHQQYIEQMRKNTKSWHDQLLAKHKWRYFRLKIAKMTLRKVLPNAIHQRVIESLGRRYDLCNGSGS